MKADPRVLRLITRLNIGGPAIQALLLTRALRDDYPTLLAAGNAPRHEGEMSDPEVPVMRIPLVRQVRPGHDLAAYRAIRKLISAPTISLVHTHMAKAGVLGRLAALRTPARKVTVHTFHGHVLEGYFSRPVERSVVSVERFLARRTDALVAVSDEVRDSLLSLGIGTPDRFHVVKLGFDLEPFLSVRGTSGRLRSELGLGTAPVVGVLGRLTAIKDHNMLLEAVARLPEVHLIVLGDGELRNTLEHQASSLGIRPRVHFLGWRSDVPECLADMDIVALTSRNEGTPVSLIEGSAAGRPVVATDVGGVRSVVLDGQTGLIGPAGDVEAYADRLRVLIADPDLRARLGAAGRDHVRRSFGQQRLIAEVRSLYDSLLKGLS